MNVHLTGNANAIEAISLLEELGYGLMALPSVTQPEPVRILALDQLIDQLQDYLRHGYTAIAVESDPPDGLIQRLDRACDAYRIDRLRRVRIGPQFRTAIDRETGASPA
jgi:hypothetical protein